MLQATGTTNYYPSELPDPLLPNFFFRAPDVGQPSYDPAKLPLRTHDTVMDDGRRVEMAVNWGEASKKCGIQGAALVSEIPGVDMVPLFVFELMHLLLENIVKNLILLFHRRFKGAQGTDRKSVV